MFLSTPSIIVVLAPNLTSYYSDWSSHFKWFRFTLPLCLVFAQVQLGWTQTCNGNKPADTTCPGGCTAVSDGDVDFTDTRCLTGTSTFTSETRIGSGGTLIVCGDLTMSGNALKINSGGTLHIVAGGKVTQNTTLGMDGSRNMIVYGEYDGITNNTDIQIQGSGNNNLWIMGTLSAKDLVVNNTTDTIFMYDGSATSATNFKLQGAGGKVCMEGGAYIDANRLEGNSNDGLIFGGPSGEKACVGVSGGANQISLNQDLTASSGLNICLSTGTTCSSCNYGSATTSSDCANCGAYLPVELLEWNVAQWDNGILAKWVTASESNNDFFLIERSLDGVNFEYVGTVKGVGSSTEVQVYSFLDEGGSSDYYYRLSQFDFDGTQTEFNLVRTHPSGRHLNTAKQSVKKLQANWTVQHRNWRSKRLLVKAYNTTGQQVVSFWVTATKGGMLDLGNQKNSLPNGIFYIQVTDASQASTACYLGVNR